jgi:hypothetical protein
MTFAKMGRLALASMFVKSDSPDLSGRLLSVLSENVMNEGIGR